MTIAIDVPTENPKVALEVLDKLINYMPVIERDCFTCKDKEKQLHVLWYLIDQFKLVRRQLEVRSCLWPGVPDEKIK